MNRELEKSRVKGGEFEERFAREMGLDRVPGSGNQWISQLDLKGFAARWSLKWTRFRSFQLDTDLIDEAVIACEGPGGTGEMPLWGVELNDNPDYDLVIMRKSDFKRMTQEELVLSRESKADARRRLAGVPQLLREED